jgi:hypothetical protein
MAAGAVAGGDSDDGRPEKLQPASSANVIAKKMRAE